MAIKKKFLSGNPDEAVDGSKVLFANNEAFRVKNASGVAEELFKYDSSNVLKLLKLPQVSADPSAANDLVRKSFVDTQVTSLQGAITAEQTARASADTAEQTARTLADSALSSRLDIVEPKVSTLETKMSAVEGRASSLEGRATSLETSVGVLNGNASVEGSVDAKVAAAVNSILGGAPEMYDTLQEVAAWIASDETAVSQITSELNNHDQRLDTIEGDASTLGSIAYAVAGEAALREAADLALDGAKASRALDNLENVSINTSLLPNPMAEQPVNLGSAEAPFGTTFSGKHAGPAGTSGSFVMFDQYTGRLMAGSEDPWNSRMEWNEGGIFITSPSVSLTSGQMTISFAETQNEIIVGIGGGESAIVPPDEMSSLDIGSSARAIRYAYARSLLGVESIQPRNEYGQSEIGAVNNPFSKQYVDEIRTGSVYQMDYSGNLEPYAVIDLHDLGFPKLTSGDHERIQWNSEGIKMSGEQGTVLAIDNGAEYGPGVRVSTCVAPIASVLENAPVTIGTETDRFSAGYFLRSFASEEPQGLDELTNKEYVDSVVGSASTASTQYIDQKIGEIKGEVSPTYDSLAKIQDKIEFIIQNSDPAALDSLAEIVAAFQGADDSINTSITNLAATASANLTAEQTRAQAAESALQAEVDAEESARIAADASVLAESKSYTDAQLDTLVIQQQQYVAKTLSAGDVTAQYVDVSGPIQGTPWVMIDGIMGRPSVDFTWSGSRITFAGEWATGGASALVAGDVLHIFFMKNYSPFV